MRKQRHTRAQRRLGAWAIGFSLVVLPRVAPAEDAAGTAALVRARAAWDRAEFDKAEPLYREAIERGGLTRDDLLETYVHLGASRAIVGRKEQALVAFRQAALLDPKFTIPPEAGKRTATLAEQARKEARKLGTYAVTAEVPDTVDANQPFAVVATLDEANVGMVGRVGLVVTDDTGKGPEHRATEPTGKSVRFEVPGSRATSRSTLLVRVDALDGKDNRLASFERKVTVKGEVRPAILAATPVAAREEAPPSRRGSFWTSPWPYLIGGLALAAGGGAVYFATRPVDEVVIGGARVSAR